MDKRDLVVILLIYSLALILWSLPIRSSPMPFGDVDSSSHFTQGDYIYQSNRIFDTFPYYIEQSWYKEGGRRYYPPHFYIWEATGQLAGRGEIVSSYTMILLLITLFIVSSYMLMRETLGFYPSLIGSFFLIFSMRDIMVYLWAQWPQQIAFIFLPMVLFSFYKYTAYLEKDKHDAIVYLILTSIFIAGSFSFHPQAFFECLLAVSLFAIIRIIQLKKIIYPVKHAIIAIALVLILTSPFIAGVKSYSEANGMSLSSSLSLTSLLRFYPKPHLSDSPTVFMSSYPMTYAGYWTLPFVILGIILIFLKMRDPKYMVWVVFFLSHLIMIHLKTRQFRFLAEEAHLFFPLFALGVYFIISLKQLRRFRVLLVLLTLSAIFVINGLPAFNTLHNAYSGPMRITPQQYNAALWMRHNLPEKANIGMVGPITLAKQYWIQALAMRNILIKEEERSVHSLKGFYIGPPDYFMVDYSDAILLGNRKLADKLFEFENKTLSGEKLIYNTKEVRIYKLSAINKTSNPGKRK